MKNGKKFGGSRGGKRFGKPRGHRALHQAVCAGCGKDCQVPFRPTGDKPVYCDACFKGNEGRESRGSFGHSNRGRDRRVMRGGGDRPFRRDSDRSRSSGPNYKKEFEMVNKKLDELMAAVEALKPKKAKNKTSEAKKTEVADEVTEAAKTEVTVEDLVTEK